jgi:hypothetical protein
LLLSPKRIVDVELRGGGRSKAIATGRNAAWICSCGRPEPLLGRPGVSTIDCPQCHRKYYVLPQRADPGAVNKVVQVE